MTSGLMTSGLMTSGLMTSGLMAPGLVASGPATSGYWMTSSTISVAAGLSDAGWPEGADG